MTNKDSAIEFTQDLVADIWEKHENKARLQKLTEDLWNEHRGAAHAADREGRLEGYVWGKLDVSTDEAKVIAALFRQKSRDKAPPAIKPHAKGMWK